jgi:hypothetical protein
MLQMYPSRLHQVLLFILIQHRKAFSERGGMWEKIGVEEKVIVGKSIE